MVILDLFDGVIVEMILAWPLYLKVNHPLLVILLMLLVRCFAIDRRCYDGSDGN